MRYRVLFSAQAREDLFKILAYIAADNQVRAIQFVTGLHERIRAKLSDFPNSAPAFGRYRYAVFGNYVAVYRVDDRSGTVRIVLVSEGHREWRRLLKDRG